MYKKILNLIEINNEEYEIGLKNRSVLVLKKCLEFFRSWSSLLAKIISFAGKFSENDLNLKSIHNLMSKIKNYDTRKEDVTGMLSKIKDNFQQISLTNSETENFEKQRESFFEKISLDLNIITQMKTMDDRDLSIDLNSIEKLCLTSLHFKIKDILVETERFVERLIKEEQLSRYDFNKLNNYYSILVSINRHLFNYIVRINYSFSN